MATIRFAPAYLHKSDGRPGIDPGTGWTQDAVLILDGGTVLGTVPFLPCDVSDGAIVVGGRGHPNTIPLPLETSAAVEVKLLFTSGDEVVIRGHGAQLELLGQPNYVEDFE